MATHHMKLQPAPFKLIATGKKTLELRLYDTKRQALSLHDQIVFSVLPDGEQTVRVYITGLLRYATFRELIQDVPAAWLGYEDADKLHLITSMHDIYDPSEEREHGVLGIRFVLASGEV